MQARAETKEFLGGQFRVQWRRFWQIADPAPRQFRVFIKILAIDAHAARARREHAGDHPQRSRLAGAVDAKQAEHFAAREGEIEVAHDGAASQGPADMVENEGGRYGGHLRRLFRFACDPASTVAFLRLVGVPEGATLPDRLR
jgi:hypothetical protein